MIKQTGHCISGALPVSGMNELKRFSGVLSFLPSPLPAGVYVFSFHDRPKKSDASFSILSIVFPSESLMRIFHRTVLWCPVVLIRPYAPTSISAYPVDFGMTEEEAVVQIPF